MQSISACKNFLCALARNFKLADLPKIHTICKEKGRDVKMYVTLNTIIYSDELQRLEHLIKQLKGKIDAIICWDLSVINLCNTYHIPFFVSTQASVANVESARFYKQLGAKRIVLARELNLKNNKVMSAKDLCTLPFFEKIKQSGAVSCQEPLVTDQWHERSVQLEYF